MSGVKVCILDYGSGNVKSVNNIIAAIAAEVVISNKPDDIRKASHLILPGVGAFGAAMKKVISILPLDVLEKEVIENKKPFLGICVGMQILADIGREFGDNPGLGWIPGTVEKLESGKLPLPHIGWNNVVVFNQSPLMSGMGKEEDFYFVHSFRFKPIEEKYVVANTEYGESFCSVVQKDNIYGVQFHPEKSQKAGKALLKNFLNL